MYHVQYIFLVTSYMALLPLISGAYIPTSDSTDLVPARIQKSNHTHVADLNNDISINITNFDDLALLIDIFSSIPKDVMDHGEEALVAWFEALDAPNSTSLAINATATVASVPHSGIERRWLGWTYTIKCALELAQWFPYARAGKIFHIIHELGGFLETAKKLRKVRSMEEVYYIGGPSLVELINDLAPFKDTLTSCFHGFHF